MDRAYTVMASTGEYSDRNEWTVAVYLNKDEAERHVELAQAHAREHGCGYDDRCSYEDRDELSEVLEEGGIELRALYGVRPGYRLSVDYTGIRFWCEEVPIREAAPSW